MKKHGFAIGIGGRRKDIGEGDRQASLGYTNLFGLVPAPYIGLRFGPRDQGGFTVGAVPGGLTLGYSGRASDSLSDRDQIRGMPDVLLESVEHLRGRAPTREHPPGAFSVLAGGLTGGMLGLSLGGLAMLGRAAALKKPITGRGAAVSTGLGALAGASAVAYDSYRQRAAAAAAGAQYLRRRKESSTAAARWAARAQGAGRSPSQLAEALDAAYRRAQTPHLGVGSPWDGRLQSSVAPAEKAFAEVFASGSARGAARRAAQDAHALREYHLTSGGRPPNAMEAPWHRPLPGAGKTSSVVAADQLVTLLGLPLGGVTRSW